MDDPGLDPGAHAHALRALARVNLASGTVTRIWSALPLQVPPGSGRRTARRTLRVLDVACGGGDVAVGLARRARRAGVSLEVHGCDRSARALDHARETAREAGVRVVLHQVDVLRDPLPTGFDLVASTLFLHHLSADEGVELLQGLAACGDRVLVQDLRRTSLGYRLAWWGLRFLSTSSVARVDGPTSVQAAYTLDEVRDLARQAGLQGAQIDPIWPQRFQLAWSRS